MISVSKAAELADHVGDAVKSRETVVIRDTMIDAFNTISEDRQWIHGAGAAPRATAPRPPPTTPIIQVEQTPAACHLDPRSAAQIKARSPLKARRIRVKSITSRNSASPSVQA